MKKLQIFKNYSDFSFSKLNTNKYRHLKLLLYWPVYGILFMYVEHGYEVDSYHQMYSFLDDFIPFNEWFIIPYMFWFVFLTGMVLYTLFYEIEEFKRMMHFIIFTYTFTIIVYFIFPTCQELRPVVFERDNVLTRIMKYFYEFDTNTNVCPSIHVIGSLAVVFAACHTKRFSSVVWKTAFWVVGITICASTVFLKQHSVIDVIAAVPVCIVGYILAYRVGLSRHKTINNEVMG